MIIDINISGAHKHKFVSSGITLINANQRMSHREYVIINMNRISCVFISVTFTTLIIELHNNEFKFSIYKLL